MAENAGDLGDGERGPGQPMTAGPNSVTAVAAERPMTDPTIDSFRLLHRIGEGGMGEVWVAEQLRPVRRQVAIKIIKTGMDTAEMVARFQVERQALALMNHRCIATVFEAGATRQGRPYFAMEYVRGEPIISYCDRRRLTTRARVELVIQLCDGVQHAHQKGIIHRDLKPSNILVAEVDGQPTPKIIDFGLAKPTTFRLTDNPLFTQVGAFVGTPEFMSPEQAELGASDIDTRTDIYALGVVLYGLLAGSQPFDRTTWELKGLDEIRRVIREVDPPRPSNRFNASGDRRDAIATARRTVPRLLQSELSGDLDWITTKTIEKDRTRRYGTASELAADLGRHLNNEPVLAYPPSRRYRLGKFLRRHRFGVIIAATLAILVMVSAGAMTLQAHRLTQERDRANREAQTARQVSDFLAGLFTASDPAEARGKSLTAREVLEKGAASINVTLQSQPEVQARLQQTIGDVFYGLGLYDQALPLIEAAVATRTRLLGLDAPETLDAMSDLALTDISLRQTDKAEPLLREVLNRRARTLGANHRDTLSAKLNLASEMWFAKRYDEAEPLALEVLAADRRLFGSDDDQTLTAMNTVSAIYQAREQYAKALPFTTEFLAGRRRAFGNDHPRTLTAMQNLANNYSHLRDYSRAEPLFIEALAGERRVLGPTHPLVATTETALAKMYVEQQRYDEAEPLALSAFASVLKTFGSSDEKTRAAETVVGSLYEAWQKPDRAARWRDDFPSGR